MKLRVLLNVLLILNCLPFCAAQGLRISTQVFAKQATGKDQNIGSSLTLCHSGRIYDYVAAADELVIYDPAGKRCIVLNPERKLSTTVSFDEIRHQMEHRVRRTKELLEDPRLVSGREADRELLRFQLQPEFSEQYDAASGMVTLSAPHFSYRVHTRDWKNAEQVEEYLAYRDWAAQLNSVLHPGSLFPEPRMVVNAALRRHARVPVSVERQQHDPSGRLLRAEHQFTMGLTPEDQVLIGRWEELSKSPGIQQVPLLRYQQSILVSRTR